MKYSLYIIYIVLMSVSTFAQRKDSIPKFDSEYYLVKRGDTLTIDLDEVSLLPEHKFKSSTDKNYYYWFRKKVFKAYPYAILASKRLDSLNSRLEKIKSKRRRRKYVKIVQNYVEKQFTDQLKKMTRTEGRVLINLIHRQTGKTAYENITELRSGFRAFFYNIQANIFSMSLKDKYEPETDNEDYLIEDVLQRAFADGLLESQTPKLKINSYKILASKKGEVNVEKYKEMFAKYRKRRKNN